MFEPGIDRQYWETEWLALEPLLEDSPGETLPEVDELVHRMLKEAGYPVETEDQLDDEAVDPEVFASFVAAREITRQVDRGEDVDPGDIGHAVQLYRELYEHLLAREIDEG